MPEQTYIILGAGVIGLTTALELSTRYPGSHITILATHLPGDRAAEYASPWAGANWLSGATDNGRQESWDRTTYEKFGQLADHMNESGVQRMNIKAYYDNPKKEAGILSQGTGKVWYESMTGLRWFSESELQQGGGRGSKCGYEARSFVVDVQVYLPWLQNEVLKHGVQMRRTIVKDIRDVFTQYPGVKAAFNCTGLGSYSLGGVEDRGVYPTRGQTLLIASPTPPSLPLTHMSFRSPQRVNKDTTYVFPRNPGGGVILGGCRVDGSWDGEVDEKFARDIMERCCALCPELGKPEDLIILQHGVGLRPSRKGGPRLERETIGGGLVIHNYGAGGAGYQASWGMAKEAVSLLGKESKL